MTTWWNSTATYQPTYKEDLGGDWKRDMKRDLEVDLKGDLEVDLEGDFKQDLEGNVLTISGQVRSRSGLV